MESVTDKNPLDKLSAKHRAFVVAFVDCMNQSEAARRAGYSKKRANRTGHDLVSNRDILAAISYLGELMGMTSGEAVRRMTRWARGSMEYFMDEEGHLVLTSDEAIQHRHLIKKVKEKRVVTLDEKDRTVTEYWTELELYDAKDAVDKVLQLHGRYKQLPGDAGQEKAVTVVYRTLPDGQRVRPTDIVIRTDVDPS